MAKDPEQKDGALRHAVSGKENWGLRLEGVEIRFIAALGGLK